MSYIFREHADEISMKLRKLGEQTSVVCLDRGHESKEVARLLIPFQDLTTSTLCANLVPKAGFRDLGCTLVDNFLAA